jgi:hypothetical protein
MANAQPLVSTSEYDDNYFTRSTDDDFQQQQQTFLYPEQQKSKTIVTKSKPRKNKRSGKKNSY